LSEVILSLNNIVKKFEDQEVVKNISLQVNRGEFLTILGSSGCGKTTTLRMIAGFEAPTSGTIILENERVDNVDPSKRNVNTVFQNYALFPHMNVYNNVAYGLRIKKVDKAEINKRVMQMLDLVQLTGFEKRKPDQLSGGQKQRVAIARAIINNPKVLLLDEPLGALDLKLRKQMQVELKRLQQKLNITFIYVTHDQEEALNMSDRIAVMNEGYLEQVGTPKEIYEKPRTKFVASFIGESNIFEGIVEEEAYGAIVISIKNKKVKINNSELRIGDRILASIRPECVSISSEMENSLNLKAVIKKHDYLGSTIKTIAILNDGQDIIISNYNKKTGLPPIGTEVNLSFEPDDMGIIKERRN
jgi:spermidine/putrescine transport system ATP-binding protein